MVVDRGGLQYTIELDGNGPERVREFRQELVLARRQWRAFKADIRSLAAESKSMSQGSKALAESTRAAARAQEKLTAATKQASAAQQQSASSSERKAKATVVETEAEKRLTASKKERLSLEKQLRREATVGKSKELQNLRASLSAQRDINRALTERLKIRKLNEANVRKQLTVLKLQKEQAKALLDLETARARAKDPILAKAKAELAVEREIAREKQKQLQNEARIAKGLPTTGGGRVAGPATLQDEARLRFQQDLRNAQIKEQSDLLKQNSTEWQRLRGSVLAAEGGLSKAGRTANRISFTFRRLFGILAAFAAARFLVRGFQQLIKEAINFNAQLEISKLSIAALLTATNDIRDATGQSVAASEQLALAQQEAQRQTLLLRLDALKTAATFEQLLDTFQIALAPGVRAGLGTDQIRQFTVRISQAATALGVAQNQLAEEIRSILAGTIQLRTTRIAAALGITNEDIRRAKEAGRLYEFLTEQFEAFGVAGEQALSTFAGLTGRVADGFKQLFGAGTFQTFERLKDLLAEIFEGITQETPGGFLAPHPDAVLAVKAISEGLTEALAQASAIGEALDFKDLLAVSETVGDALQAISVIFGVAIEGFIRGLDTAAQLVQAILAPFKVLFAETEEWGDALRAALVLVVQITTAYYALLGVQALLLLATRGWLKVVALISGVIAGVRGALLGLVSVMVALRSLTAAWALVTKLAAAPLVLMVAAIALIVVGAQKLLDIFADIDLELGTILKIVKNSLVSAFKLAWISIKAAGAQVLNFFEQRILDLQVAWIEASKGVSGFIAAVGEGIGISGAAEVNKEIALARVQALEAIEDQRFAAEDALAADLKRLEAAKEQVRLQRDIKNGQAVLDEGAGGGSLASFFQETFQEISATLGGIFDMTEGLGGANVEALTLLETLDQMPGILARSRIELSRQVELMSELEDDAQSALRDVANLIVGRGAESGIAQIRTTLLDSIFTEGEKSKQLNEELVQLRSKQNGLLSAQKRLEADISALTAEQRFEFEKGLDTAKKILLLQTQRAEAEKQLTLSELERAQAASEGDTASVLAAKDAIRAQEVIISGLDEQLSLERTIAETVAEGLGPDGQEGVVKAIKEQVLLAGNLNVTEEQINAVLADQAQLHDLINQALQARIRLLAQQQLQRLDQDIPRVQNERSSLQRLRPFVGALNTDAAGERVAQAQNQVAEDRLALIETEKQALRDILVIDESIAEARRLGLQGEKDLVALTELRGALLEKNTAQTELQNEQLSQSAQLLQEAVRSQEEGIQYGLEVGFADFARQAVDAFEVARNFMQTSLQSFSQLISQTIADAFDPTVNTSIRERFGQFLKSLSRMILNALVSLAISKLVASLIGGDQKQGGATMLAAAAAWAPITVALQAAANTLLTAAVIQKGSSYGFAAGGEIPSVSGGLQRPRGLPATDVTPIWATPGEYMVRRSAVQRYGTDIMEALNQGLIDPSSLRALAGAARAHRTARRQRSPGFADGGLVSSSVERLSETSEGGSPASIALVVADDQAADRILNGGKNAVFSFFGEYKETLKSILGS